MKYKLKKINLEGILNVTYVSLNSANCSFTSFVKYAMDCRLHSRVFTPRLSTLFSLKN